MSGRLVVITGGSRGIGREAALRFARAGYRVLVTSRRSHEEAAAVAEECRQLGPAGAWARGLDLTDTAALEAFARETVERFGRIDVLVNNAGVIVWNPLERQTGEEVRDQIESNLLGAILLTRSLLPHVGTVLNLGSDLSTFGMAELTVYCAAKFGLRGFSQALALERPEMRVLCVNPDRTATRMNDFQGRDPAEVAEVLWRAAEGHYAVASGGDVNLWDLPAPAV